MTAVDAKALAEYGTDRFGTRFPCHLQGWTYGQQSALLAYLMIPFVKILGLNILSIRLPMAILSSLAMATVFFLVRAYFNEKVGALTMLLLAVNPFLIISARWSLDCNAYPHVFAIGLMLFLLSFAYGKKFFIAR